MFVPYPWSDMEHRHFAGAATTCVCGRPAQRRRAFETPNGICRCHSASTVSGQWLKSDSHNSPIPDLKHGNGRNGMRQDPKIHSETDGVLKALACVCIFFWWYYACLARAQMLVSQGVAEAARNRLDLPFVSKCISMCVPTLFSPARCTADIRSLVCAFTNKRQCGRRCI